MDKITLSVIKADVGSIGGHTQPSEEMLRAVKNLLQSQKQSNEGQGILRDYLVTYTGDDIALIMSHRLGTGAKEIHQLAWKCFLTATAVAKSQGLYGAGQDLLHAPGHGPSPGGHQRRGRLSRRH